MSEEFRRILYVDDEQPNLTVFEAAFEDDYEVHLAESGAEALDVLAREPAIQLLITDMRMPGMSGVQLLENVIPRHPNIIRMILTGYTDIESVVQAVNQGQVYQYITKPWDEDHLRVVLDRALDHHDELGTERRLRGELSRKLRQEEAIRTVFQRFVPESVVQKVLGQGGFDKGLPQAREVTLMFCDLRGFTTLCSQESPTRVLRLLNEYFDVITGIVERHGGTVNQFLGDALFACFGAPVHVPQHERAAVRASLDMRRALEIFNKEAAPTLIGRTLSIGIGLQSGPVAVGNVGSPDKVTYTAIGDAVYEVNHVEAACKGHENAIVCSARVLEAAGARGTPHGELPSGEGLFLVEGL